MMSNHFVHQPASIPHEESVCLPNIEIVHVLWVVLHPLSFIILPLATHWPPATRYGVPESVSGYDIMKQTQQEPGTGEQVMATQPEPYYSPEEYIALERAAEYKSE